MTSVIVPVLQLLRAAAGQLSRYIISAIEQKTTMYITPSDSTQLSLGLQVVL